MVKTILLTSPNFDVPTSYLDFFLKKSLKLLDTSSFHVTLLESNSANATLFSEEVSKNHSLIHLNGHGNSFEVCGKDNVPLLTSKNISSVSAEILYALACESLSGLGKLAPCTYVGYSRKYSIVVNPASVPAKDNNCLPFFEANHVFLKSLFDGKSVSDCVELKKQYYEKLIRSYGSTEDVYGDSPLIALQLAWNLEFFGYCGDGSKTIYG